MIEFYENELASLIRVYSYFGITFFYLFLAAHSLYYKRMWEFIGHGLMAIFLIMLFLIVLIRGGMFTDYVLTPYLFGWLVISFYFLYRHVFVQFYKDKLLHYMNRIKGIRQF